MCVLCCFGFLGVHHFLWHVFHPFQGVRLAAYVTIALKEVELNVFDKLTSRTQRKAGFVRSSQIFLEQLLTMSGIIKFHVSPNHIL